MIRMEEDRREDSGYADIADNGVWNTPCAGRSEAECVEFLVFRPGFQCLTIAKSGLKLSLMRVGQGKMNLGKWAKLALVLTVLCSGQIYPYVHFHHTHELQGGASTPGLLSTHHSSRELPENHDRHQHTGASDHDHEDAHRKNGGGHDHHHLFNQHTDCFLIRSNVRCISISIDYSALPAGSTLNNIEDSTSTSLALEEFTPPECVPIGSIDSRGPPVLS
jgi:hypothetical protein